MQGPTKPIGYIYVQKRTEMRLMCRTLCMNKMLQKRLGVGVVVRDAHRRAAEAKRPTIVIASP